jgi:mRNA interferase MazF
LVMKRGELWWAALPEPRGSDSGYRRPVLIVQADPFNRSSIQTVIVVALTSNLRRAEAPGNVMLRRRESRLANDSVVNVSQLATMSRQLLVERISQVPLLRMQEVDSGLRRVLSI